MVKNVKAKAIEIYRNGNTFTQTSDLWRSLWGTLRVIHLEGALGNKEPQINETEWDTSFDAHVEAAPNLQDSKIASLRDWLQEADDKLKTQVGPKTKDCTSDSYYSPLSSLTLRISLAILYVNCLSTLKRPQDHKQKSAKLAFLRVQQLQGQKT